MNAEEHKQALLPGFQLGASLTIQTLDRRRQRFVAQAQAVETVSSALRSLLAESRAASMAAAS